MGMSEGGGEVGIGIKADCVQVVLGNKIDVEDSKRMVSFSATRPQIEQAS